MACGNNADLSPRASQPPTDGSSSPEPLPPLRPQSLHAFIGTVPNQLRSNFHNSLSLTWFCVKFWCLQMTLASSTHQSGACTCSTHSEHRRFCSNRIIFTDTYDRNRIVVDVDALRHTFVALVESDKSAALTAFLSEDLPRRVLREFLLSRPIVSAVPLSHEEQLTPRSESMRTCRFACAPTTNATKGSEGADAPTRHASTVQQPMLHPSATGVVGTQRRRKEEPTEEIYGTTAPTSTSFPAACNEAATLITASGQRIATMIESIALDIIFTTRFARIAAPPSAPSSLDATTVAVRTEAVGEEHGGNDATNATPQSMPQSPAANVPPSNCDQNDASHNALRQSTSTRSAATAAAVQRHPHTCRVGYHSDHPYTCLDVAAMNNNPLVAEALRRGADGAAAAATGAIAAAVAAGSECEVLVHSSGDHSTSTSGAPSVYHYPPAKTQFVRWLRCHCFDGRAALDTFGFGQSSPHVAAPTTATVVPNIRSRPPSSPTPPPPLLQLLALESNSAAMLRWILAASLLRPSISTAASPSALSSLPLPSSASPFVVCPCCSLSIDPTTPSSPPLSPPSSSSLSSSLCSFGWPCSIADAAVDREGRTLLHVAAGGIVTRRVVGGGVDDPSPSPPSAAGVVASTASLVASAVFVQMVAIRLLIAEGADVNAADARGRTPLFAATQAAAKSARRNNTAAKDSSSSSHTGGRPPGEEEEDDFSVFSPPPASLFLWQAHAGRAPQIVRLLRDKGASLRPLSLVVPTTRSSVHASPTCSPSPSGKRTRSGVVVVAAQTAAAALAPAAVPSVPATTTTVRTASIRSQEQRKHFRSAIALFGQLQRQREQRRQQQQQQPLPSPSSDTPTSPPQPPLPPPPPSD